MLVQQKEILSMIYDKLNNMFDEIEDGNKVKLTLSVTDIMDDLSTMEAMAGEGDEA